MMRKKVYWRVIRLYPGGRFSEVRRFVFKRNAERLAESMSYGRRFDDFERYYIAVQKV